MTPFEDIYTAFLAKVSDDDWDDPEKLETYKMDWCEIMMSALVYFKFPRVSLEYDMEEKAFTETLSEDEIQVIATYMKVEWLERIVLSWENVKTSYSEKDFSQANLLDKFRKLLEKTEGKADKLQRKYYRSVRGKPYPYKNLYGRN